jgi:hypothetical protein
MLRTRLRLTSTGNGDPPVSGFLLDLQVQEIDEQDWLLAILARTAETHDPAEMVALRAAFLAEVADVAGCAFINGVRDERGSLAESFPKKLLLQVWQGGVAETEGALAAGIGAKAAAAATPWVRAQQAVLWGTRRCGIVIRIVTDGVCGDGCRHAAALRRAAVVVCRLELDDSS